eukprot:13173642-Ditylum_brightwellii.AAC.1
MGGLVLVLVALAALLVGQGASTVAQAFLKCACVFFGFSSTVVGAGGKTEKRQTVALAKLTVQSQPGPVVDARLVQAMEAVHEDLHLTSSRGRKH